MSEQVKTPLPGEVTGNEAVDAEAVIQKRIADAVTAYEASQKARGGTLTEGDIIRLLGQGGGTGVNEPAKPAPIKAFGQEFESPEALEAAVKAHIATLQQAPPVQQQASAPPQGFDEKQFTSLLDQPNGTPKALEYALRHSGIYQEIETLKAANQALRMKETAREVKELVPGFTPKNPQEVALIDQIRQQMGGAPDNPIAWEGAVTLAAKRGLIKLDGAQPPPQTPRGTAVAPPYTGPSSASDSAQEELMSRAWNLPLDQLEKLRSDIAAARGR